MPSHQRQESSPDALLPSDSGDLPIPLIGAALPSPLTSFIGREREVAELVSLLQQSRVRLLTLTGPGGVGKTRLAVRVAEEIAASSQRRVAFIELASLTTADAVPATIGRAFGIQETGHGAYEEEVAAAIADARLLLVLDNFERVVGVGPLLTGLLSRCANLTILVTSRIVLRVSGEYEFAVPPLEVPGRGAPSAAIDNSPSVQLFQERVRTSADGTAPDEFAVEMPIVAEICRRLDGLPLAIELAAARTRVFSPAEMLQRLQTGLALLSDGPRDAPSRLRSMHDAVAWSYGLLTLAEQRVLRLLSVFSGGFTLASAEALATRLGAIESGRPDGPGGGRPAGAASAPPVFEIVSSLTDQSLVQRYTAPSGHTRFKMLETIREFGLDMLVAEGEEQAARNAHAQWFTELAREPASDRVILSFVSRSAPRESEQDNLRAAIAWSLSNADAETAGLLASRLWGFWAHNGLYTEARATLARVLQCPGPMTPDLRASLLLDASRSAWCQSDFAASGTLASEAQAIYEHSGDRAGVAACLVRLGDAALASDPPVATSLFQEALVLLRAGDDIESLANALNSFGDTLMFAGDLAGARAAYAECRSLMTGQPESRLLFNPLGWVALAEGDLDLAEHLLEESVGHARELGYAYPEAVGIRMLGRVALARGDLLTAADRYHRALTIMIELGASHEAGYCVAELAAAAAAAGEAELAARWLGFEEAQRGRQSLGLSPDESSLRDEALGRARALLGADAYATAWEAGHQLTAAAAFAEARAWRPATPSQRTSALTRRELEILHHLAAGRTNREIAGSLFLGTRTIDTHVSSILTKLGVTTRHAAVEEARKRALLPSSD
ncbi:MAG: AAA family ATPase [Thermomicrobiales bacterium]|nr:AAA family ATPase [Thermomicrobiales bacterium]